MFNLAEVLTLIIGLLLALVFIDGVRRSLRSRTSSLKVDLVDSTELSNKDFEQEWLDGYDSEISKEEVVEETHREIEELDIDIDKNSGPLHQLLIINQSTDGNNTFSYKSISHLLVSYSFMFDERGYFVIADEDNNPLFSI